MFQQVILCHTIGVSGLHFLAAVDFLLQFYREVIYLFIQADATELTNVFFLFFVHLKHAKFECVKFMWFSPASEVERGIITTSVMWSVCRKIKSKTR